MLSRTRTSAADARVRRCDECHILGRIYAQRLRLLDFAWTIEAVEERAQLSSFKNARQRDQSLTAQRAGRRDGWDQTRRRESIANPSAITSPGIARSCRRCGDQSAAHPPVRRFRYRRGGRPVPARLGSGAHLDPRRARCRDQRRAPTGLASKAAPRRRGGACGIYEQRLGR
jgi:hypothetical protein